jgi:hypothetical protein
MFIPDATDTSGVFTGTQGGFTGSEYIAYNLGSAPSTTTDKLYNVSGALYWNGQTVATGTAVADLVGLTDTNITNPADGQVLTYDLTSTKWINIAGVSTLTEDIFTGDGTTVIFDVTNDVIAEANLLITVDGIVQPNSAWTLTNDASGDPKRVTLSGAPLTGQTIRMLNVGISSTQTMVPSTGSVTASMLSSQLKEYAEDNFTTVDAITVNFDCGQDLLSETSIIVTVDGVTQPSTAFSLSTDAGGVNQRRVILSEAPETGANVRVLNLGMTNSAGSLSAGVVNATHLAPALKNFYDKTFTGDGTTVNYDMDYDILAHGRDLLITVDGIVQTETTHYTIGNDGNSNQRRVIFGSAPITGTAIRIMHLGVATSTSVYELVNDVTPQLGGQLDVNSHGLGDGTNELLKFTETGSAVNEFMITNAATGSGPNLSATGDDTNIDINITPKGTGTVTIAGDITVTGTVAGVTATHVGLGNVTDESKATMFTSPAFTGTATAVNLTLSGDLTINGLVTTINSTTLTVDDKNIELGSVASPDDTTADGGGITLKGAPDKTILWTNSTDSWHFNQGINITSGNVVIGSGTANRKLTIIGDNDEPDLSLIQLHNANDNFNEIRFMSVGSDDSTYRVGANIRGIYTSHSATSPETDIAFQTRNSGGTLAERMRIDSAGLVTIANALTVTGAITGGSFNGTEIATFPSGVYNNLGIGVNALDSITTGGNNTALGDGALTATENGQQNLGMGRNTLTANVGGSYNIAIGDMALATNVSGTSNVAIGKSSLYTTTGSHNTAIGEASLFATTGSYNVGIGKEAGDNITTGSSNIIIGAGVDAPSVSASNQLNIGNTIYGDLSGKRVSINTTSAGNYNFMVEGSSYSVARINGSHAGGGTRLVLSHNNNANANAYGFVCGGTDTGTDEKFAIMRFNASDSGWNDVIMMFDSTGAVTPGSDNTGSLGLSGNRWANLYVADINLSNKGNPNEIDGTEGTWTVQEGDENLFVINRITGKKFKINLTEV